MPKKTAASLPAPLPQAEGGRGPELAPGLAERALWHHQLSILSTDPGTDVIDPVTADGSTALGVGSVPGIKRLAQGVR